RDRGGAARGRRPDVAAALRAGRRGAARHAPSGRADRRRAGRPLRGRVRRGGADRRRGRRRLMPQPNMQQMLKQVQKMQAEMVAAQEQLKDEFVEASAGGGMVTVKVSGDLDVKSIAIDPEAVDPEDVELLQDMVLAAVNEALRAAQEMASKKLGGITGGLGGPGGLGGLGLPGF